MRSLVNKVVLLSVVFLPVLAFSDTYALKLVATALSSSSPDDAKASALASIYDSGLGGVPAASYSQIPAFSRLQDAQAYCTGAGQTLVSFPSQGTQDANDLVGSAVPFINDVLPFQNTADNSTSVDSQQAPTKYGAALEFLLNCGT